MSSNSYWRSEDDEILIDFVRNHEAIYNIKSKEYRKTQLKQKWWREIGDILNKTDYNCFKRWCYIRDYYVRRRGKPGTGSCGEAAKKRSDLLSFLDSLPTSQRSTITYIVDETPGDSNVMIENTHDANQQTQNREHGNIIIENTHSNSEETPCNTQEIICDSDYNRKDGNAKSDKKRKNNAHAQEHLNLLKQIANWDSTQNVLDETDLFFGSMAKIVKKLPRYEQAQLRMQIGSLVGNAELRHISNNSPQIRARSPRPSINNSDYYENLVHSPRSTTTTMTANDHAQIVAPSPQGTQIKMDKEEQIYLVSQTDD